jgi:hypothetical protein
VVRQTELMVAVVAAALVQLELQTLAVRKVVLDHLYFLNGLLLHQAVLTVATMAVAVVVLKLAHQMLLVVRVAVVQVHTTLAAMLAAVLVLPIRVVAAVEK